MTWSQPPVCQRPSPDRADLAELARMLQQHTPMCKLTDMEARAALELAEQRGWRITKETSIA
ncbi:hypothetical protein BST63_10540 [Bradyrhizobium canariense]|uniref:Uncharacterized protein n=1 Tax=Bradyrhizobium canariense TaxID=255045 RepID=A0ABX3X693_9BRAD|nr:hypothetical protein BSR47_11720 [Bradyrhizobium canariense]OSJ31075.1 hypothetical protein BST63_10540 [Bradyrhizobium canariense]